MINIKYWTLPHMTQMKFGMVSLPLKVPSKICSRPHSIFFFPEEISVDISCQPSAWQTVHMLKKIKKKKSSAAVVIGALSVNLYIN